MNTQNRITYYDLREEALAGRLPVFVGRDAEMRQFDRLLSRRTSNNMLIVGPAGAGKTALAWGWLLHVSTQKRHDRCALVQLDTAHLYALDDTALEERYAEAFDSLPRCVLFIDDFGREIYKNAALSQRICRLYRPLLQRSDVHVVLTLLPHEYAWLVRECPAFVHAFDTITLKEQKSAEYARIVSKKLPLLNARHRIIVPYAVLDEVVAYAERFPQLGVLPRSAIRLLDEAIAYSAAEGRTALSEAAVAHVVAAKTGVPRARIRGNELDTVKRLEADLNARVVQQEHALKKIATTLQRAKLGLRNPNRPLGTFLLLGPSGVGKTETAKAVAELLFGRADNIVRFDMSEYQQEHTVQRLIGAPPGYIGYEEGGAVTNALKREPYSLLLLDEIEKAHPKVFDIFLQVLDDGRITSGENETVDARNAIIMATSNAAVAEILSAHESGMDIESDSFVREVAMPILAKTFRLEFLNRFDAVVIFRPLTVAGLMQVARLELTKVEKRLVKHNVRFDLDARVVEERIRRLADTRFGARPVKRFIEETCESLLAQSLLENPHAV